MIAYLPCTDDPTVLPTPCIHDQVIVLVDMPQGTETDFAVLLPVVFGFQDGVGKNERGIRKVHPMLIEVLAPFLFTPFKTHASILYKCIYDIKHHHDTDREA
jgi:hypothetical protein